MIQLGEPIVLDARLTTIGGHPPLAQLHRPDLKSDGGEFRGTIGLNEVVIPVTKEEAQKMAEEHAPEDLIRETLGLEPFEAFARRRLDENISEENVRLLGYERAEAEKERSTGRTTRMLVYALAAARTGKVYLRGMSEPATHDMVAQAREMALKIGVAPESIQPSFVKDPPKGFPLFVDHAAEGLKPKRTCNLHDDCDAAEAQAAADGKPELYGPGSSRLHHCYDEGCEDCFGS